MLQSKPYFGGPTDRKSVGRGLTSTGAWELSTCLGAYNIDVGLASALSALFEQGSVLDLGAGCGQYSQYWRRLGHHVTAYDGVRNIAALSNGLVHFADLTSPPSFQQHDWVFYAEVGEHLPEEHEDTLLRSIARSAAKGVVLTWSNAADTVNAQTDRHIALRMGGFGFLFQVQETRTLRARAGKHCCGWFQETLLVFRRANSTASTGLKL